MLGYFVERPGPAWAMSADELDLSKMCLWILFPVQFIPDFVKNILSGVGVASNAVIVSGVRYRRLPTKVTI